LFRKAGVDLKAAQILHSDFVNGNIDLDIDVIFFHIQQSAEKLIKALLSFNQVNYPKIHDMEELINILEQYHIPFEFDKVKLIDLGDYAVEGRYAIIHDDFKDAEQYIQLIEKLKNTIGMILFSNK
jgi:HEPN domain-containing protein